MPSRTTPPGQPFGRKTLPTFQSSAPAALADEQLRRNLRRATTAIRAKRASVAAEMPDWEALRATAAAVKRVAMERLEEHLDALEESVVRAGGVVHRARDASEANAIIGDLVRRAGAREVVKVKSLTTDEVGLNQALASKGIQAIETDLAELIIQLAEERSSHFLVPAIHKNRTQIRDLFRERLDRPELSDEPRELAEAARIHLRKKFLEAEVAVSGANFAIAETGTVGVVESEGNGRMCLTLPRVLVTLMGVEKVLPTFRDLEVFLQLLPRSATGERMNPYTTLWTGVTPGDGPQEFHLVLLDNGRRGVLADPLGRQALHCIRCSACLNICPVYERVGGHAYNATYPGPIGSILTPQLLGPGVHDSLPFASTLCGACAEVCPVGIEIPRILLHLRSRAVSGSPLPVSPHFGVGSGAPLQERWLMRALGWVFRSPRRFLWSLRVGRSLQRLVMKGGWIPALPGYAGGWTLGRDLQALPQESFREWWQKERGVDVEATPRPGSGTAPVPSGAALPEERGSPLSSKPSTGAPGWNGSKPDPTIPRQYHTSGSLSREETLDRFVERVSDYRAKVIRTTPGELPSVVAARLGAHGIRQVLLPPDLPVAWLAEVPEGPASLLRDGVGKGGSAFTTDELASCDGAITGCAHAIAETGTLILDSGRAQGRRALSLLPDYHLCVVLAGQVVETVPEGLAAAASSVRQGRPLTLVSGPSATSDIELVRVEGVHGPRTLEVVLLEEES
jgi:L-lactate dehydrogenase complex protein LldF